MTNPSIKFLATSAISALFVGGVIYADTTQTATAPAAPTDAQITKIVMTANNGEIDQSKLAKKSTNKDVKALATEMVAAHTKSNTETEKLARTLELKPEDSATSDQLKADCKQKITELKTLKGADFDKAYIDAQVDAHQAVLANLNDSLIPSAKNPDLKSLLEKTRTVVEAHLEHAKKVQTAFTK